MGDRLPSVHPGRILRFDFLEPLELTPYRLAKDINVPLTRVTAILAGRRSITADTALRLARYFGTTPAFWLNLQALYEMQEARALGIDAELERIRPIREDGELAAA
jgi:addiction module HigA family antidote